MTPRRPEVSIITITYNQEAYIEQTLNSLLGQITDFNYEIIVADDCSSDNTPAIIDKYSHNNPAILKPILRNKNIGAWSNFVDALKTARGQYIALCEGDDFWTDPKKLQQQLDYMRSNPKCVLSFHPVRVFFENGEQEDAIFPEATSGFTIEKLLERNYIQTNSVMYRRQNYSNLAKDIMPGDWYLHLYHAQFGEIGFINKNMAAYRRHKDGIWWQSDNDIDEIWKKYGIQHYKLYVEMLKLYGDDTESKKIIYKHIADKLDTFIDVDKRHSNHLVKSILEMFPETVEEYVVAQHQTNISREHTILIKDAELAKIHAQLGHLELMLSRKNQEVSLIKASRIWKLRNRVAKLIGKKPV